MAAKETGGRMSAPNEFVWYKWWPAKALTSLRWASLTVTEEGVYRRLYDLASLAQPSSRRGYFYEHDVPASTKEVLNFLRIDTRTGQKCIDKFAKMQLMNQDENGAWGFPNFGKHQRGAMLRPRPDGLGSAEAKAKSQQIRDKIGATDKDIDVDVDKDKDKETSICPEPEKSDSVPAELQGLELYQNDTRLHKDFDKFLKACEAAYPGVDLAEQIKRAHAWEVANPKRRKVNRKKYLHGWLAREQDKPRSGESDLDKAMQKIRKEKAND